MGYLHINNLYKEQIVLYFKKVWATEKIHGTSAWILYKDNKLQFHPGGAKIAYFISLFNEPELLKKMKELFGDEVVRLHGEHYGGKIKSMKDTYGDKNAFVMFDIRVGESWLSFDKVQLLGEKLGLDVVDGTIVNSNIKKLDEQRDLPSVQAKKNGIKEDMMREGIVIRPLIEMVLNNGDRVIAKHKGDNFRETTRKRKVVNPDKLKVLKEATDIAFEWVTAMRLNHILDKLNPIDITNTGDVIKAMIIDITREGKDEIEMSKEAKIAISKRTALIFKEHLTRSLK